MQFSVRAMLLLGEDILKISLLKKLANYIMLLQEQRGEGV